MNLGKPFQHTFQAFHFAWEDPRILVPAQSPGGRKYFPLSTKLPVAIFFSFFLFLLSYPGWIFVHHLIIFHGVAFSIDLHRSKRVLHKSKLMFRNNFVKNKKLKQKLNWFHIIFKKNKYFIQFNGTATGDVLIKSVLKSRCSGICKVKIPVEILEKYLWRS